MGDIILILRRFCQGLNAVGSVPVVIATTPLAWLDRVKQSRFVPRGMQPDCRASLRSLAMTRRSMYPHLNPLPDGEDL